MWQALHAAGSGPSAGFRAKLPRAGPGQIGQAWGSLGPGHRPGQLRGRGGTDDVMDVERGVLAICCYSGQCEVVEDNAGCLQD